ncbi:hypothetical protein LZ578_10085 [Jeotgalibaca sp. MA1X17-3]|uniref:hypothetical protein n=1 Tax=Jeotgalibaca sp. MA1X17-3 TaxID=2908211 RepID=UPI001F205207|nr:hypothetical protein [Jeotgalibaca sp. MA1X17-3]UJF15311.1 hypothetical protein LZ578_10085 [Jeotgalibaca sp. MA1X17-3]
MAILTESTIRKLLRTTDLKQTKVLHLEPGTIITPSAKSYLNDITVIYRNLLEEVEGSAHETIDQIDTTKDSLKSYNRQGQEVAHNHFTLSWNIKLEKLLSTVLFGQQLSHTKKEIQLTAELDTIVTVLEDFRRLIFYENYWEKCHIDEEKFGKQFDKIKEQFSPGTFIPKYTDGEVVLMLYGLYTDVRELELYASSCFQNYLLFDDYCGLVERCRFMAEYIWSLMINRIEGNGRRE